MGRERRAFGAWGGDRHGLQFCVGHTGYLCAWCVLLSGVRPGLYAHCRIESAIAITPFPRRKTPPPVCPHVPISVCFAPGLRGDLYGKPEASPPLFASSRKKRPPPSFRADCAPSRKGLGCVHGSRTRRDNPLPAPGLRCVHAHCATPCGK